MNQLVFQQSKFKVLYPSPSATNSLVFQGHSIGRQCLRIWMDPPDPTKKNAHTKYVTYSNKCCFLLFKYFQTYCFVLHHYLDTQSVKKRIVFACITGRMFFFYWIQICIPNDTDPHHHCSHGLTTGARSRNCVFEKNTLSRALSSDV